MGMYLGKEKVAPAVKAEVPSMKAYLEAGGKCKDSKAISFDGCWQASDWENVKDYSEMFSGCKELTSIPAMNAYNMTNTSYMFKNCEKITSVRAMNTKNVTDMRSMFFFCKAITTIPMLDTSNATNMENMFGGCSNLESIHMYGMKVAFDIHYSTKFARDALVEILDNLATVTTSPTLTMGSTNLAKLTDEDKTIATGKGWKLA